MKLRINEETRREYESNALSNLGCNSNAKTPPRISAQSHAAKISFRKSLANILGGRPILGKMPFVFSPLSLSPPSSFLIPSLCCFFQNDRALSSLPHLENLLFFLLIIPNEPLHQRGHFELKPSYLGACPKDVLEAA